MFKTTIYLPRELKEALARLAGRQGRSEAELVR
jgi:predicted DNA-binding protein